MLDARSVLHRVDQSLRCGHRSAQAVQEIGGTGRAAQKGGGCSGFHKRRIHCLVRERTFLRLTQCYKEANPDCRIATNRRQESPMIFDLRVEGSDGHINTGMPQVAALELRWFLPDVVVVEAH